VWPRATLSLEPSVLEAGYISPARWLLHIKDSNQLATTPAADKGSGFFPFELEAAR
jgi:hypothetical protein